MTIVRWIIWKKRLEAFNASSRQYLGYVSPVEEGGNEDGDSFEMKVYFARQVREHESPVNGTIDLLNEVIELPKAYIQ